MAAANAESQALAGMGHKRSCFCRLDFTRNGNYELTD